MREEARGRMDIRLVKLFDRYAPLLTERQRQVMALSYNEDESLSEISENTGISRQGARDCLKKTEAQLLRYEEALGLVRREEAWQVRIERALELLRGGETDEAERALTALLE